MLKLELFCYAREGNEWFPVYRDGNWDLWTWDPSEGVPAGTICPCIIGARWY